MKTSQLKEANLHTEESGLVHAAEGFSPMKLKDAEAQTKAAGIPNGIPAALIFTKCL